MKYVYAFPCNSMHNTYNFEDRQFKIILTYQMAECMICTLTPSRAAQTSALTRGQTSTTASHIISIWVCCVVCVGSKRTLTPSRAAQTSALTRGHTLTTASHIISIWVCCVVCVGSKRTLTPSRAAQTSALTRGHLLVYGCVVLCVLVVSVP